MMFKLNVENKSAKEYYELGLSAFNKSAFRDAIKLTTKSINLNYTNSEVYRTRASAYFRIKKYRKAIKDFSAAISISPNNKESYLEKGLANNYLRNYNDAINDYSSAIKLDLDYEKAYVSRGLSYFLLKDYSKALSDMEKSVELNNNNESILRPYIDECKKQLKANPKNLFEQLMNNPIVQEQKKLFDMQNKMIDNIKATDQDEIPWGIGEFGYEDTNPIPTLTSFGNISYFARLRTMDGEKVKYKRLGSSSVYNIEMPVDIYEISDSKGFICRLYVSMYHKRNSEKAPRNFKRV